MVARYPGATWMPAGSDQGGNNGPTTVSFHGAITRSGSSGIAGWVGSSNACHGFVEKLGAAAQFKDYDRVAYGMLDGNKRGGITWETWDGLVVSTATYDDVNRGADDRPEGTWTPEQCERIADIIAWDDVTFGIEARTVRTTRDRAHGMHGHGIPNRSTRTGTNIYVGPDRWSSDSNKPCPGDKRIAQWPGIITRAQVIRDAVKAGRCDWLPQGNVDLRSALARTGSAPVGWWPRWFHATR